MCILVDRNLFDQTEVFTKEVLFNLNLLKNKEQLYLSFFFILFTLLHLI